MASASKIFLKADLSADATGVNASSRLLKFKRTDALIASVDGSDA
jgi:hypothetical protein